MEDNYHDITPIFAQTAYSLRREIEYILETKNNESNSYHIDFKDPFRGLFERKLIDFRYIVNETKGEYLDRETAQQRKGHLVNPLPLLLAYAPIGEEPFIGYWIGDSLQTTDALPSDELKDMTNIYLVDI